MQGASIAAGGAGASAQATRVAQQVLRDILRRKLWMTGSLILAVLLTLWVGIVSRGIILRAAAAVPADTRTDLERLQGDWQVIAFQRNGQNLPKDEWPFTRLLIRDHTMFQEGRIHDRKVSFWPHPEREPKSMDMQIRAFHSQIDSEFPNAPYTLEGHTLTISRREEDEGRAASAGKPGSNIRYTARRIAPAGP